jgi:hypothetical protein
MNSNFFWGKKTISFFFFKGGASKLITKAARSKDRVK